MNVRIAHVDLTAFFVSVERLLNPQWVGQPVMVEGPPESRGVVTCASYEVRPYAVHAGMPTSVALRKCPMAIRLDGHYEAYRDFSQKVQEFLRYYSPVFEPASIDEFYMDGSVAVTNDSVAFDLFNLESEKRDELLKSVDGINARYGDSSLIRIGFGI